MFLGATYFAKHLPARKFSYGVLLDMIGDKNLVIRKEPISARYAPDLVSRFYKHAQTLGFGKHFPDEFQMDVLDDHLALNEAGIPTMDLIDFDYPSWHTLEDTPDKCSADSLGVVGKALESFLQAEK
jgi:hypothetical protein